MLLYQSLTMTSSCITWFPMQVTRLQPTTQDTLSLSVVIPDRPGAFSVFTPLIVLSTKVLPIRIGLLGWHSTNTLSPIHSLHLATFHIGVSPGLTLCSLVKCNWAIVYPDTFLSYDIIILSYSQSCNRKHFKSLVLTTQNTIKLYLICFSSGSVNMSRGLSFGNLIQFLATISLPILPCLLLFSVSCLVPPPSYPGSRGNFAPFTDLVSSPQLLML